MQHIVLTSLTTTTAIVVVSLATFYARRGCNLGLRPGRMLGRTLRESGPFRHAVRHQMPETISILLAGSSFGAGQQQCTLLKAKYD